VILFFSIVQFNGYDSVPGIALFYSLDVLNENLIAPTVSDVSFDGSKLSIIAEVRLRKLVLDGLRNSY